MTGPERRVTPRATCFGDIHFEPNNGGIVLNVSEGGLCFHSIAPVHRNGPIRFWFSLDRQRIQAAGEFVWMDHTQQTGGLRFTALPAVAREEIRNRTRERIALPANDEASSPSQLALRSFLALGSSRQTTEAELRRSAALATIPPAPTGIMRWQSWSSFSGGLAIGILVSAVMAVTLLLLTNRQQFGKSIIWLGEQVAAKPPAQNQSALATPLAVPPTTPPIPVSATAPISIPQQAPQARLAPQTLAEAAQPLEPSREVRQPLAEPAKLGVAGVSRPKVPARDGVSTTIATIAVAPTMSPTAIDVTPNSNLLAAKAAPVPPAWPTSDHVSNHVVEAPDSGGQNPVQTPEMYFQVGRFKDEFAAKKETDELGQMGFPSTDVQKSRFWSSSYAVLVGPYGEDVEAKSARKSLISRGFKPQPLEKGSRELTFSHALIVNGVRLPVGNCTIRWESYGNQVSVEFVRDKNVIATVDGKWVNQPVRYDRNAFAYIRGTGSLVEIRFAGMTRTLVFGKFT